MSTTRVLFVCLGNICRSPTAHGVFQHMVDQRGWQDKIKVDSAGTSDWHIGHPPDKRTVQAASQRGYDLSTLKARQACRSDFHTYNYILAMDQNNLRELQRLCPENYTGHLSLFLHFSSQELYEEIPDPYYGGARGFETVLDLVENASQGLLEHISTQSENI